MLLMGRNSIEKKLQSIPTIRCSCSICRATNQSNNFNSLESGKKSFPTRSPTGNIYVDGILWGGHNWLVNSNRVITYSFWGNSVRYGRNWKYHEIAAMEQALRTWSNVANIKFVKTRNNNPNATLKFHLIDNSFELPILGMFYPPGTNNEGNGYFNFQGYGWNQAGLKQGGYGFTTLLHELGHGLGLAHPHDKGGGSFIYPRVTYKYSTGNFGLNQGVWTTMSYNDGLVSNNLRLGSNYGYQGTPMTFDIAAVQYLYGANKNYRSGNDTYTLPSTNKPSTFYSAIWDTGGIDTITAAGMNRAVNIDLRQAPLKGKNAGGYISSAVGINGGYTIANRVTIEKAIGGLMNDRLIGNIANNVLFGGNGNDFLHGGGGKDRLLGAGGRDVIKGGLDNDIINGGNDNDIMSGGPGNDTFVVNSKLDRVLESVRGGIDRVISFAPSYILSANVESLTLAAGAIAGSGNNKNNYIKGNHRNNKLIGKAGNDSIDGGNGNDIMSGGPGNDTFVVNSKLDRVLESVRGGIDRVISSARIYTISANVENLTLTATAIIGSGNSKNNRINGNRYSNKLIGKAGNDTLNGGAGNDRLVGGAGSDVLMGGTGADRFVFNSISEKIDTILDFNRGQRDKIAIFHKSFGATSTNQFNFNAANGALLFRGQQIATLENIDESGFNVSTDIVFL